MGQRFAVTPKHTRYFRHQVGSKKSDLWTTLAYQSKVQVLCIPRKLFSSFRSTVVLTFLSESDELLKHSMFSKTSELVTD